MYFPQFLIAMVTTSGALAAWTYGETGSVWSAVGWAMLALVLLQVGYFLLVLGLIYGSRKSDRAPDLGSTKAANRAAQ